VKLTERHRAFAGFNLVAVGLISGEHDPLWELACRVAASSDGGLTADLGFVDRVHIHFCGNGHLGFRFYSESLGTAPSNQGLLPLAFGASLRLGMPSLRSCSVGRRDRPSMAVRG
jgi:hypothetical protein